MVYFDVPLLLKQQFFESTTWLKALTDFSVETMGTEGYTKDCISRILSTPDNNFPMPSLLF